MYVQDNDQDNDEVYVFYATVSVPEKIVYKKALYSNLAAISTAPAITVLSVPGVDVNEVTSAKDYVDTDSSLVVAASGGPAYYTSIVMHAETKTGGSTGSTTVASAPLTGKRNHRYLAAIVTSPAQVTVSPGGVAGLDLNWTEVDTQCSGRGLTRVTVYSALAKNQDPVPLSSGAVTAMLSSTAINAKIAVSRYSGVDSINPLSNVVSYNTIGPNDTTCDGGEDNAIYSASLPNAVIDGAVLYGAVARLDIPHIPGPASPPYTERGVPSGSEDIPPQGSGDTAAGVAVVDRSMAAASSLGTVDGGFSGAVDWAVIAIELRPPHTP